MASTAAPYRKPVPSGGTLIIGASLFFGDQILQIFVVVRWPAPDGVDRDRVLFGVDRVDDPPVVDSDPAQLEWDVGWRRQWTAVVRSGFNPRSVIARFTRWRTCPGRSS